MKKRKDNKNNFLRSNNLHNKPLSVKTKQHNNRSTITPPKKKRGKKKRMDGRQKKGRRGGVKRGLEEKKRTLHTHKDNPSKRNKSVEKTKIHTTHNSIPTKIPLLIYSITQSPLLSFFVFVSAGWSSSRVSRILFTTSVKTSTIFIFVFALVSRK